MDWMEQIRCRNKGEISSLTSSSGKSLTLSESIFERREVRASSGVVAEPSTSHGLAPKKSYRTVQSELLHINNS